MKYDFSHEQMYEISAKIIHIKKFQLYLMKRAPNGNKTDVTAHFFMLIEGNMVSEHEMRQIGSARIERRETKLPRRSLPCPEDIGNCAICLPLPLWRFSLFFYFDLRNGMHRLTCLQ